MAASGIAVSEALKDKFAAMKLIKKDKAGQIKFIAMKISDDKTEVIEVEGDCVLESYTTEQLREYFCGIKNECRFALYDFGKLILIKWAPDSAPVTKKMLAASTFDALKKAFDGVKTVEATELDDLRDDDLKNAK